ncbi:MULTISPECIES: TraX family protein [unclassified Pseudomonas]|uniref:TraX family protein n=1 Tax=unclassified Pseudomonas TaxID=196821 RepID=UPI00224B05D7|nr:MULTISPECIES: TraX family protein [unclassified Pseudomonas]MCX2891584.1 TraX family protein [Pseudomonas sp. DCB_BI]MDH4550719.1 conjugal transfer protein TraX [Pseudomonas sp. BN607]
MRSAGLDLVKWTAMLTMVVDHLRFLWPETDGLFVLGRLAFPLFCLAIAVNVGRAGAGALYTRGNLRYLALMLMFVVLSEPAYRWLDSGSQTFSVMPTLALGLVVAWGVHHPLISARVLGIAGLLAGWLLREQLMYGLPGVLLPGACLMARRQGGVVGLLPCLLAAGGNLTNSWLREHLLAPFTVLTLVAAALAIPLGVLLLRQDEWRVPAVGRWGYLFYPLHLLAIKVLS